MIQHTRMSFDLLKERDLIVGRVSILNPRHSILDNLKPGAKYTLGWVPLTILVSSYLEKRCPATDALTSLKMLAATYFDVSQHKMGVWMQGMMMEDNFWIHSHSLQAGRVSDEMKLRKTDSMFQCRHCQWRGGCRRWGPYDHDVLWANVYPHCLA